jgi:hypothetical protein
MMDYNLQGMNFLDLRYAKFRRKTADETSPLAATVQANDAPTKTLLDEESIRKIPKFERLFNEAEISGCFLLPESVSRLSSCELEIDGVAPDVLNTNNSLLSKSLFGSAMHRR